MARFPSIEEVNNMLDKIADDIPPEIFQELNEGIVLLPQYKLHPKSRPSRPLYILGQYSFSITGRNIRIYYGSFKKLYKNRTEGYIYSKLRETLMHELTHHLESLAGQRDLIIEDIKSMKAYEKGE